jgi:hypothetical protein
MNRLKTVEGLISSGVIIDSGDALPVVADISCWSSR